MVNVISVANQKGGVGKTTTTINLAASIADRGYRVLIVDIDPQGNATSGLGIEKSEIDQDIYNVAISDQYDFVFIDCPPSLGQLSINAFTASDSILIPVQSEYYAMEGLSQLLNTIRLVQKHFNKDLGVEGVLLTMLDARTNLGAEVVKEVQSYFSKKVYKTIIPRITKLAEAPSYGQPITEYAPRSRGAKVYDDLAKEVLKAHGKRLQK